MRWEGIEVDLVKVGVQFGDAGIEPRVVVVLLEPEQSKTNDGMDVFNELLKNEHAVVDGARFAFEHSQQTPLFTASAELFPFHATVAAIRNHLRLVVELYRRCGTFWRAHRDQKRILVFAVASVDPSRS